MKNNEFIKRRELFASKMEKLSFALLFSGKAPYKTREQYYPFTVNKNFYYLTGLQRENFTLLILNSNENHLEYLFIEEPSEFAAKWFGRRLTKEEASEISGIDINNIYYTQDFDGFISNRVLLDSRHAVAGVPQNLYLDMYRQFTMVKPFGLTAFEKVCEVYPELRIKDLSPITDYLRMFKSETEINQIEKAIAYTNEGIKALMQQVVPGKNERELESLFEYTIKNAGSNGTSFDTILASGVNATVLHYAENNTVINDSELVLTDLGALSGEYAADITRTFPANGKFTERQKAVYQLVLDVNKKVISAIKPGVYVHELNQLAQDMLTEGLIKLGKIKDKTELSKYYFHMIGHYLGLDVHDVGTYKIKLEPGIVLTVEPGLYIEEEKIGVRIEDNILVTETGYKNLSKDIIKEIDEIEEFMKKWLNELRWRKY